VEVESGTLALSSVSLRPSSVLNVGLNSLSDYGKIALPANVALNGTLRASLNNGFLPAINDAFNVLSYPSFSGLFDNINLPPQENWSTSYSAPYLTLTVTCGPPPVPATVLWGTAQGQAVTVPVAKVLANATTTSGGPLSVTAVSSPSTLGGTVVLSGGSITYTPPSGYPVAPALTAQDQFNYTLSDECGNTAQGTVTVTIVSAGAPSENVPAPGSITVHGCVNLVFSGIPGTGYVVQTASSPAGPWTDLSGALTAGPTGEILYQDCRSLQPAAYYRLRLGP
jgi:hypothetical protein